MRVLTAEQMQKVDAETIARVVPGLELMERAGVAVARAIRARYPTGHAAIFGGPATTAATGWWWRGT